MSLLGWLAILVGLLVLIRLLHTRARLARMAALTEVARSSRMNFSPVDRFDLARRLQQSPSWTAGLSVRDVVYGVVGNERRFIATLERRASDDDNCRLYVLACVEAIDHGHLHEVTRAIRVESAGDRLAAYEAALAEVAS